MLTKNLFFFCFGVSPHCEKQLLSKIEVSSVDHISQSSKLPHDPAGTFLRTSTKMILHDTEKLSFGNTSICAGLDPHLPCKTRKVCIDVVYLIFPFESHLKECCLCLLQLCQRLLTGTINTRGKPQLDGASLPSLLLS